MKTIAVTASKSYEVKIGPGLLQDLPRELRAVTKATKLCIVSDHTVWSLYGDCVKDTLTDAGFSCVAFCFPAGEQSKCGKTWLALLEFLAEQRLTRSDCVIALGGGVVGDLTGFAAASYLRGIDYVQVPTTLLAAVDSSVGGKTAIDLEAGKNLAGAFYQPKLVLCDTDTLRSLPDEIFRDGCAEVIKYGILYDPDLFAHLKQRGPGFDREAVIARCVELKRDVVAVDELDRGQRQKLNLGHTLGHGVEAQSHFTLSHGKAVAIGMAMIARAAEKLGLCREDTRRAVEEILLDFSLPTVPGCTGAEILSSALSDKKRQGGTVNLIVPREIGRCDILPTPVEKLPGIIEAGM